MDEAEVLKDCSVVVVKVVAKDCRDDVVLVAWEDENELGNELLVEAEDEEKNVEEAELEGEFEEDEGKEEEEEVEATFFACGKNGEKKDIVLVILLLVLGRKNDWARTPLTTSSRAKKERKNEGERMEGKEKVGD